MVRDLLPAVLAHIHRALRLALRPPELRELQNLELAADRARYIEPPWIALRVRRLNPAHAGDLRRAHHEHFPAGECVRELRPNRFRRSTGHTCTARFVMLRTIDYSLPVPAS